MHLTPASSKYFMKLVFGIYMMITLIVLINLLIAMMSDTYQRIQVMSVYFRQATLHYRRNRTPSGSSAARCSFAR